MSPRAEYTQAERGAESQWLGVGSRLPQLGLVFGRSDLRCLGRYGRATTQSGTTRPDDPLELYHP